MHMNTSINDFIILFNLYHHLHRGGDIWKRKDIEVPVKSY